MHHSSSSDHARHDLALIAGHAAGDLADSERPLADTLLAGCTACVDLRRDLVAIAAATRALPAPFTLARDLRLDPAQAKRLRRGSWLRGALRPFAAGDNAVRPMAAAFTSLGVAGLLVATVLPSLLGPAFAPAAPGGAFEAAQATDAAEGATGGAPVATEGAQGGPDNAVGGSSAPAAQPQTTPERVVGNVAKPSGRAADDQSTGGITTTDGYGEAYGSAAPVAVGDPASPEQNERDGSSSDLRSTSQAMNPLLVGSLGLLVVGLLLFGLRFAARRLR